MADNMKQTMIAAICVCALFCVGCKSAGGGTSFWPFASSTEEDPAFRRELTEAEAQAVQRDNSFPTYQQVQMQAMQSGGTVLR